MVALIEWAPPTGIIAVGDPQSVEGIEKLGYHCKAFSAIVGFFSTSISAGEFQRKKKLERYLGHFACASGGP